MKNNSKLIFTKAKQSYLWDLKNNKYIDFSMSNGALLLGHSSKRQMLTLKRGISNGLNYNSENIYKYKYANELLKYFNDFHEIIFSNSGSEANIRAYRICKALTNKDQFVMINGSWHGSLDPFMFDLINQKKKSLSAGNKLYKKKVHLLPHNDINKSIQLLNKIKKKISMIIIECVQASFPEKENINYLKSIYQFAKRNKILIVFDEIITGMRVKNLAIHKKYKLKPDIVTFGKCFGSGLPIGLTLINKKISNKIKFLEKKVFFGGTFSGNPFVTINGFETFKFIKKNKKIHNIIDKESQRLQNEINNFAKKHNCEFRIIRYESILRPIFTSKKIFGKIERSKFDKNNIKSNNLRDFLLSYKIVLPKNGCIFISLSHTRQDINKLIFAIKVFLKKNAN